MYKSVIHFPDKDVEFEWGHIPTMDCPYSVPIGKSIHNGLHYNIYSKYFIIIERSEDCSEMWVEYV